MRLYSDLAPWWPLLSSPADYAEEAGLYLASMQASADGPIRTMLEIGSGGGNNASHLKAHASMALVEPAEGMLTVSRALNPECEHIPGDMRDVRLGRTFDAVFIHDAICYMTTADDLRRAIETAAVHCRPGGVVLLAPDHVKETFAVSTDCGGHDGDGRSLRYLEWTWDPDPADTTYTVDYVYALREADGPIEVVTDRHIEGLFPRALWLDLMAAAGFDARVVSIDHSELEPGTYEVFVGRKR